MNREAVFEKLHKKYNPHEFDNADIWAGNLSIKILTVEVSLGSEVKEELPIKESVVSRLSENASIVIANDSEAISNSRYSKKLSYSERLLRRFTPRNDILGQPVSQQSSMTRIYLEPDAEIFAIISAELYLKNVTDCEVTIIDEDIDVRLWTDIDDYGYINEKGEHYPGFGGFFSMTLLKNLAGMPQKSGNNIVFTTGEIPITKTGVFNYTVEFSADNKPQNSPGKDWLSLNDIAMNDDGIIVVMPSIVSKCPSVTEICLRKHNAKILDGKFTSGKIKYLTADIENVTTKIIYLLPFFLTGTKDIITGVDVKKGALGSIYAVKDFFKISPDIISSPDEVDLLEMLDKGLIRKTDISDLLTGEQATKIRRLNDLTNFRSSAKLVNFLGEDVAVQLIGRAEMRELIQEAHRFDKLVIFDLVLMQTSRDSELINQHRDWYEVDENNIPRTHQIAWLHYSDVAKFRLTFNKPLQNFLSGVAPFWIKTCDFDGIRIDASQTVDRPFLKQIKNRINAVKSDAIVLGETLCAMCEAIDVPTDMIYSLLIDHHVHIDNAAKFFDLFDTIHNTFVPSTVAIAYFENHDSARATKIWHWKYFDILKAEDKNREVWRENNLQPSYLVPHTSIEHLSYIMALLKNIQASVINATAGSSSRVNFAYALELGADYGEEQTTDFENESVLYHFLREKEPHSMLYAAYKKLAELKEKFPIFYEGEVVYLREGYLLNEETGKRRNGKTEKWMDERAGKIISYIKYNNDKHSQFVLFISANLDACNAISVCYPIGEYLSNPRTLESFANIGRLFCTQPVNADIDIIFNTYTFFTSIVGTDYYRSVDELPLVEFISDEDGKIFLKVSLKPLQTVLCILP